MSMTDPIADFLTRIRNGQSSGKPEVNVPASKVKLAIAKVLKDEGYIEDFAATQLGGKPTLAVQLKYYQGRPVIDRLERVSRPGLRVYKGKDELPSILGGMRVGVTLAVVGAIVGEWAGAERGLGVLINLARGSLFDIPLMFATLLTIALVGIALYLVVVLVERRLVGAR